MVRYLYSIEYALDPDPDIIILISIWTKKIIIRNQIHGSGSTDPYQRIRLQRSSSRFRYASLVPTKMIHDVSWY